jgi:hypothetical protein
LINNQYGGSVKLFEDAYCLPLGLLRAHNSDLTGRCVRSIEEKFSEV